MSTLLHTPPKASWLHSHIFRSLLLLPLFLFSLATTTVSSNSPVNQHIFLNDYLTPYPPGRHGSKRTIRDISNCQHTSWENRTYETFKVSTETPISTKVSYNLHKFADITRRPLGPKYLVGTIAYVDKPYHSFSILEPGGGGGCSRVYGGTRSTVGDTAKTRKGGCKLAANAGFFVMVSGQCLGNIVSEGRIVRTAGNEQNANFGIREDGTMVVGYIPDEEIHNETNPFRHLVTGVVWLVRNGTNYVNESKRLECSEHEDTGGMDTFVNVVSARSALGHDAQGRLVIAQIEGQTHRRGANLIEFADLLVRHGVVNAINLDGGGSSTLLEDGVLINYPSDHCVGNGQYRCPRAVSTTLCVHDVDCLDPDCSGHGQCARTECICDTPWTGPLCQTLNCSSTNCSGRGNCSNGRCECEKGWTGDLCDKACPSNKYGNGCRQFCWCFGNAHCHPVSGHCVCPPGFKGYTCMDKCNEGYYGSGCKEKCAYPGCSGHGECSTNNGSCVCKEGWIGPSCNVSEERGSGSVGHLLLPSLQSSLSPTPSPTPSTTIPNIISEHNNSVEMCRCNITSAVEASQCGDVNNSNNTYQSSVLRMVDDSTLLQWTVATSLLISLLTLVVHVLFCYISRHWAYMALCRTKGSLVTTTYTERASLSGGKKRLKRRKPRPKYQTPLMLHYSSSTDCSL